MEMTRKKKKIPKMEAKLYLQITKLTIVRGSRKGNREGLVRS
jgi:hypothetical protein